MEDRTPPHTTKSSGSSAVVLFGRLTLFFCCILMCTLLMILFIISCCFLVIANFFYKTTTYRFRQHVQIHVVEREQIITIESSKCCHTKLFTTKKKFEKLPKISLSLFPLYSLFSNTSSSSRLDSTVSHRFSSD